MSTKQATQTGPQAAEARMLLDGLRALVRSQQVAERANVSCCGMTVAQAATLQVLHREGKLRLGTLGERLGIAPSTLTRNIERIEARGWVERIPFAEDGRTCCLRLTAAGRRQARRLEEQELLAACELLDDLTPERRRRAVAGLIDLLEALDRVGSRRSPEQFKPVRDFLQAVARGGEHVEDRGR